MALLLLLPGPDIVTACVRHTPRGRRPRPGIFTEQRKLGNELARAAFEAACADASFGSSTK